ncbi:hypothetical protein BaRGS_00023411 [Batillaria attramentaria]|uniref:Ig-like domain-containing protein n=1 Tax=Batillaria attramentaria TaxID=370345 RepID=A0ABD0KE86_9CAEN
MESSFLLLAALILISATFGAPVKDSLSNKLNISVIAEEDFNFKCTLTNYSSYIEAPQFMQISKLVHGSESKYRILAHMSTAESARLSRNVSIDFADAAAEGNWSSETMTLSVKFKGKGVSETGTYRCAVGYLENQADEHVTFWIRTVNITDTTSVALSVPLGFEGTRRISFCAKCPSGGTFTLTLNSTTHEIVGDQEDGTGRMCSRQLANIPRSRTSVRLQCASGETGICLFDSREWVCYEEVSPAGRSDKSRTPIICIVVVIIVSALIVACVIAVVIRFHRQSLRAPYKLQNYDFKIMCIGNPNH